MVVLIVFAFLAGIVTILSPCILPVLPIVLSSSIGGGKRRPFGVVAGFVASFTFFTLFLTLIVKAFGVRADGLRTLSIVIIFLFGVSLLVPQFQALSERLFSRLSGFMPRSQERQGFMGGLLVGISIGLLWTPCVGPILASVIALALTGEVTGTSVAITFAYALGTAIPMLAILFGGRRLLTKVPFLSKNGARIQKAFGVLMIATAVAIYFNADRTFQTYILEKLPGYGTGLTKIEEIPAVTRALRVLQAQPNSEDLGKPMFEMLDVEGTAPDFIAGGQWLNSPPLTLAELKGKVVLVDFWTYTCINCIRTLPYVQSWHEKYAGQGLVVVGVHTPEFEFEKNADNVKKAIADFGLTYPVMQDNEFATWRAYNNRYWPAKYLIDAKGNLRYHHFGEGRYDETEEVIQKLLTEAGFKVADQPVANPSNEIQARTPELYLGYGRIQYLASPEPLVKDSPAAYSAPGNLPQNFFSYQGIWELGEERANPSEGSGLRLNFEAKNVFLVISPKQGSGRFEVLLDGERVNSSDAGEDVVDGTVVVESDRLYDLIHLQTPGRHLLELRFLDGNLALFAFTFG